MALRLLQLGMQALTSKAYADASEHIQKSIGLDQTNATAWRMLAISYENQDRLSEAFTAYEMAARLAPDDAAIMRSVAILAGRLGHRELAKRLLQGFLERVPGNPDVSVQLASILRDQHQYADAIDLMRNVISGAPEYAAAWQMLGSIVEFSGDTDGAVVFYEEALRLQPDFCKVRRNLATCLMLQGDSARALEQLDIGLAGATEVKDVADLNLGKAANHFILGDLISGFDCYEGRFDGVDLRIRFAQHGQRWTLEDDLRGKRLLVYGEFGIGDEVLFSSIINEVIEALGSEGRLYLAVEPRLVTLFQRSFPQAVVITYEVQRTLTIVMKTALFDGPAPQIDLWVPQISLFRRFRRSLSDFPASNPFLLPDPERVAYWREQLQASGEGPYVGLVWKSINTEGARLRYYTPFELWEPILKIPKARFINLQYGDIGPEQGMLKAWGAQVLTLPGLDLKMDIEDLTALCAALDLVIGPSTATTNFAAAVGTRVWLSAGPGWWTGFGGEHAPAYPTARVFRTPSFDRWDIVTEAMAEAMGKEFLAD